MFNFQVPDIRPPFSITHHHVCRPSSMGQRTVKLRLCNAGVNPFYKIVVPTKCKCGPCYSNSMACRPLYWRTYAATSRRNCFQDEFTMQPEELTSSLQEEGCGKSCRRCQVHCPLNILHNSAEVNNCARVPTNNSDCADLSAWLCKQALYSHRFNYCLCKQPPGVLRQLKIIRCVIASSSSLRMQRYSSLNLFR